MTMIETDDDKANDGPTTTSRRDLATRGIDALDRNRVGQVTLSEERGGVRFRNALEVMEFAKLMSVAGTAVPKYLRNNPGACLAIAFQADEWRMSPFSVANQSYEVNDRVAYQSMLIHAVIESRAPLKELLDAEYAGEGPTRTCTIIGKFRNGTERQYTSPQFQQIRVKNSPLWVNDPDQQLFYYSSRSWARRWCPNVLLGIYAEDELEALAPPEPTFRERLAANGPAEHREGYQPGHMEAELASIAPDRPQTILPADDGAKSALAAASVDLPRDPAATAPPATEATSGPPTRPRGRRHIARAPTPAQIKAAADRAEAPRKETITLPLDNPAPASVPINATQYVTYCTRWIEATTDRDDAEARWEGEREQRKALAVPLKVANSLRDLLERKFPE